LAELAQVKKDIALMKEDIKRQLDVIRMSQYESFVVEHQISYIVSFGAGVLTFFSPCLLPLIPSYIVYLSGVSLDHVAGPSSTMSARTKTLMHGACFSAGFSLIFILLGLTATVVGKMLFRYQDIIRIAGGALIILFGIHFLGIINFNFLMKERKFQFRRGNAGYIGSFLVGVTFAAAWTPCAGPILGSILVFARSKADVAQGAKLLTAYSLGVALPFLISSFLIGSLLPYFKKAQKIMGVVKVVGGVFLILLGIAILTGYLQKISFFLAGTFS